MRSGRFVKQNSEYTAFIPSPLPPSPPLEFDDEMITCLSRAEEALGRLDGTGGLLPNHNLFVAMYVRKEAVLSSQIEGTQSSLNDLLEFELDLPNKQRPKDVSDVVNYVKAMNYGLKRVNEFPVSVRLIKEIHAILLKDGRGGKLEPGEFRRSQNWIGPAGCRLKEASFVPPPVPEMIEAMSDLEKYFHENSDSPPLIQCGLIHAQFETIHPFLDGNGRIGRLLITFLLCQKNVLELPLLYLSYFLKLNRLEYYDRLMAIRTKGDWEGWIKFYLNGIYQVSKEGTDVAKKILRLREEHRQLITKTVNKPTPFLMLLDLLYQRPMCTIQSVARDLNCTSYKANKLIVECQKLRILTETTKRKRNRHFSYEPYRSLFETD